MLTCSEVVGTCVYVSLCARVSERERERERQRERERVGRREGGRGNKERAGVGRQREN